MEEIGAEKIAEMILLFEIYFLDIKGIENNYSLTN
jgi:hypothetical protein